MEQPKVESIEQDPSNDSKDSVQNVVNKESQPHVAPEMETGSGDILIDTLKIEPVVTEITTEIAIAVINNDAQIPECYTNSQPSSEPAEQPVKAETTQIGSTNIEIEVTEQSETSAALEEANSEATVPLDPVKPEEVLVSEVQNHPVENEQCTQESEENMTYVEESVIAQETCDPSAMSVVEEIVTTSKSAYSVEIQEQDSTNGGEAFVTKNLVMLEVVSESEGAINEDEDQMHEMQIEQTQECDGSIEKIPTEILLSEAEVEDNSQSSAEAEVQDETIEIAIVEEVAESDENEEKLATQNAEETSYVKTSENHRSVIQEIVDDWIDDTNDDVCESKNNASDSHDSVEIELKTLLAEDKPSIKDIQIIKEGNKFANKITSQARVGEQVKRSRTNTEFITKEHVNGLESKPRTSKGRGNSPRKGTETISHYTTTTLLVTPLVNLAQDTTASKQKAQTSTPGTKVTARHLMSQIASKDEVTEVLKERIKLKQKDIELPQGGDILFVKKITQRLSSKLSAAGNHALSGKKNSPQVKSLSSENHSNNSSDEKPMDDAEKIETADNRELLAILEGDVDPDWSNLKPQSVPEASKSSETVPDSNTPGKLDRLTERELALKQLLELPSITLKKNAAKKKKTFKPAPSRSSTDVDETAQKVARKTTVVAAEVEVEQNLSAEEDDPLPGVKVRPKAGGTDVGTEDYHVEESRSGRKRKPTEKAREHEQNSTKKQKVYKGKITEHRKSQKIHEPPLEAEEPPELERQTRESDLPSAADLKTVGRNILSKITPTKNRIYQSKPSKMGGKLLPNIAKRGNMPGKKLLRQKGPSNITNPKTVHMKSKFTASPKKYRNAMKQKVQKRLLDVSSSVGEMKPKKKSNEIDKLLQDEGVVNLLYDVEQPERKRLIPITKSQTKVMDLHKVQRELKIRTKLVRNAVLRLRTSGGTPTKISSRSKRTVSNLPDNENRENERNKSTRSSISSNPDFIYPAKIRNAADASVIVRRHSSSSFSSTSGSPRASIDGPDRQMEASGSEEGPAHVTRSSRRRHSQNEKNRQFAEVVSLPKKNGVNRKKSTESADVDVVVPTEKGAPATRPNLRTERKSVEKTTKNSENIDVSKSSSNGSGSKITTRSNGTPGEKDSMKTKKGTKTKAAGNRAKDVVETEMEVVEEDKLSACLAEAASALSNVDGTVNQSGSTPVNRKLRTPTILSKISEKLPPHALDQFSNEEINLRRHGNIVQLILTPSSTKFKNGFTLQILYELREALMLLRRDEGCRVVLLTSTGTTFCEGLDLSNLIHENKEERRVHAEEMANGVKEFIKTLANFNKPIVAGIQGAAVGLGVTMLPLFDLVIASDKATFSTPYGQLGQIPEGAAILTLSQTVGNTITSELLLGGRILTASEALRAGLVTRVLWPDRFQGELIPSLRAMSEHSSQSMEATKTLLRHSLRKKLDAALESESYLLIQHWCSAECQTLIKIYLDGKGH